MDNSFKRFSDIVRRSPKFAGPKPTATIALHPFEDRNMHPDVDRIAKRLFDNGHYSQATFEAYKFLDKRVQKLALREP